MVCTSLGGCASVWDDLTSKDFSVQTMFVRTDPIQVLQETNDGDRRARALRALGDAKRYQGEDRTRVVALLCTAATQEKQFLCRIAAVDALGNYAEPAATQGLKQAFYASNSFSLDLASRLQMQVVSAMGRTGQPEAEQFLSIVVKDRPKVEGSEQERQMVLDVRLAAVRALGRFNDARAVDTLQDVLKAEKDVALRDCAREALREARGEKPLIDLASFTGLFWAGPPREEDLPAETPPK